MKKRIILIIGILIALIAIWQSVMGQPLFRDMISNQLTNFHSNQAISVK